MQSDFRELVAALCHEQWSGWMKYLFNHSRENIIHEMTIPAELTKRWKRQAETSYECLIELEKGSDRIEADKFIELFSQNFPPNLHATMQRRFLEDLQDRACKAGLPDEIGLSKLTDYLRSLYPDLYKTSDELNGREKTSTQ